MAALAHKKWSEAIVDLAPPVNGLLVGVDACLACPHDMVCSKIDGHENALQLHGITDT